MKVKVVCGCVGVGKRKQKVKWRGIHSNKLSTQHKLPSFIHSFNILRTPTRLLPLHSNPFREQNGSGRSRGNEPKSNHSKFQLHRVNLRRLKECHWANIQLREPQRQQENLMLMLMSCCYIIRESARKRKGLPFLVLPTGPSLCSTQSKPKPNVPLNNLHKKWR